MELNKITISIEEYKELLVFKGKYEELSKQNQPIIIKYDEPVITPPYKITC